MKELTYLKGFAKGRGLKETEKAINVANVLHEGQTRKSGIPYISHPVRVAASLIALGINDDKVIATALLHDVIEDCNVSYSDLIQQYDIDSSVVTAVRILSKGKGEDTKRYYGLIQNSSIALLVKIADRCHNVSTMNGVFTVTKIKEYIQETEEYVLPLCKHGKTFYPQYSDQIFSMKYQIESILEVSKILVSSYEGK